MTRPSAPSRYPLARRPLRVRLDQTEFASRCGVHPDLVRRFVALGLVRAVRDADGALWFSPAEVAAVARVQRLHAALPLNYAAVGLVTDLLERITELETALRVRGRTQAVRPRAETARPDNPTQPPRSTRWT